MRRVLVVEDERALARALAITLRAHGYDVRAAGDAAGALEAAASWRPELVVLDLGLPDLDGTEVLAALRGWSRVPVVVLSARQGGDDIVDALDAGADDYVTKPFDVGELLARLRAVDRRRLAAPDDPVVVTASFTVDLPHHRVVRHRPPGTSGAGDEPVALTPTEWALLEVLARHAGTVVGREALLRELRGPNLAGTATHYLRVYVAQLRRKLEDDPAAPRHLLTEPGIGYRLEP